MVRCARTTTGLRASLVRVENLEAVEPFTTLDGSTIREVAGPAIDSARNQSLAEASVPPGGATAEHYHRTTEEIYFFTHGSGRMRLGDEVRRRAGRHRRHPARDAPQALEQRRRAAAAALLLRPAYSHEDTVITEDR